MRRVFLLRHAKSDWNADYRADHDRPLNARGCHAAALVGRHVAALGHVPEIVLSSSAVRALTTARLAIAAGRWDCELTVEPDLYESTPDTALDLIRAQDGVYRSMMLVGHEPTWSALAGDLVGGAPVKMPTGALARIDFEVEDWTEVDFAKGVLAWLVTPKVLAAGGSL